MKNKSKKIIITIILGILIGGNFSTYATNNTALNSNTNITSSNTTARKYKYIHKYTE